jgi:inosine triphosphate pyrophosphatase
MKQNIVFVTGNKNKLKEVREILGENFAVVNVSVDLPELQSMDVKEVIVEKIKEADKVFRDQSIMNKIKDEFKTLDITINSFNDFIVVCEDSGFHIDSMNNSEKAEKEPTKMFPGALIKFYLQSVGARGVIERDRNSNARLSCYIGIIRNGEIIEPVEAIVEGKVADEFIDGGFGFDPCFVPDLSAYSEFDEYVGKPYSTLPSEVKNKISHRSVAFNKLREMLSKPTYGNARSNYRRTSTRTSKRNSRRTSKSKAKRGGSLESDYGYVEKYMKYKTKYLELKNKD